MTPVDVMWIIAIVGSVCVYIILDEGEWFDE